MTIRLYLDDSGLREADVSVIAAGPDGVVLDRTPFYARSGGQPGDTGRLAWPGGEALVLDTVKGDGEGILHVLAPDSALPPQGAALRASLDWPRRHALMRMHTTLHLLCTCCAACCPAPP